MKDFIDTFDGIEKWLNEMPGQMNGISCYFCQTGEVYISFLESGLARPADVKMVESHVAKLMHTRLSDYLDSRKGMIYWRTRFETSVSPFPVVKYFDETGPDIDFVTNRKCVSDHNWVRVACYCRLYRATHAFDGFTFNVMPTALTAMAAKEEDGVS